MKEIDEAFFVLPSSRTQKSRKSINNEIGLFPKQKETESYNKILDKGKIKTKEGLIHIQHETIIALDEDESNIFFYFCKIFISLCEGFSLFYSSIFLFKGLCRRLTKTINKHSGLHSFKKRSSYKQNYPIRE